MSMFISRSTSSHVLSVWWTSFQFPLCASDFARGPAVHLRDDIADQSPFIINIALSATASKETVEEPASVPDNIKRIRRERRKASARSDEVSPAWSRG
jgi:hypothetical protein